MEEERDERRDQLEEIDTRAFTDRYGKLAINVAPVKAAAGWSMIRKSAKRFSGKITRKQQRKAR
nr:hypothetical protein [Bradyrhizobium sp. 191]